MKVNHTVAGRDHPDEPLAGFSQCHLGILSQLQAFVELPALQAAAAQARHIAASTLALFKNEVHEHHVEEESVLFPAVLRSAAPTDLGRDAVERLVRAYLSHARFEEQHFLPLAELVLGRNSAHMAALGRSLHLYPA